MRRKLLDIRAISRAQEDTRLAGASIALYLAAIVAANLSVALWGPGVSILNAFLFIGLDLTARDNLHDVWKRRNLWRKMFMLIAAGSLLSFAINRNAGPIALASFVAFAAAGVADALTYHCLGERTRLVRVNGSNIISAGVDSMVFPALAFGFPLLVPIMVGQFVAKVAGGFVWMLILEKMRDE